VSGVEAAKLIAPGAAKLAVKEAAEVIAVLVEVDAQMFGQDLRALLTRSAPGDDSPDARGRPN
jgi:hypothetical protein